MNEFLDDVKNEYERATKLHGEFRSLHEAYAVILEEVDELWDEVREKKPDHALIREELIQIAAMAIKTADFLGVL